MNYDEIDVLTCVEKLGYPGLLFLPKVKKQVMMLELEFLRHRHKKFVLSKKSNADLMKSFWNFGNEVLGQYKQRMEEKRLNRG